MFKKYWWLILIIVPVIVFGLPILQQGGVAPLVCTQPLIPEDGAKTPYGADLLMTFSFTPMEGVELYHLNVLTPSGNLVTFELEDTQAQRVISSFTEPGDIIWNVEALNDKGEIVCTSDSFSFTVIEKEALVPEIIVEETEETLIITPTPGIFGCAQPLTPENGAELPKIGKEIFSWAAVEDATRYLLTITVPSGNTITFEGNRTEIGRYMEAFEQGGEYQWAVTALNAASGEICESTVFTFSKLASPPESAPPPKNSGGGGGDGGDDDDDD
ncbi:MAG: hypothetical protein HN855_10630 [Anaerolineae bacterium]|jgi:hypothetical protein|nr:hypothetical protein [Anaerolineae bacterium]MBT7071735.1 hypothetical protein [Anaerolineae bacterium]MBT7325607.1 hypothetical protein [Anaerolineae bacterium]